MNVKDKNIGFAITGSFQTFKLIIPKIKELINLGARVIPIMSYNAYNLDTKYGKSEDVISSIEETTKNNVIHSIQDAEYIGHKKIIDIIIVAPCTRKHNSKTC